MRAAPKSAVRPVVMLGGWGDPIWGMKLVRKRLAGVFVGDPFVVQNHSWFGDFDRYRDRIIASVDKAYPTSDPHQTVAVDVVGHSMGGLLGRYAAMPLPGRRRLNVQRLFTISTPHRGARMAWMSPLEHAVRDMKPGSIFLETLDAALPDREYELVMYVRQRDWVVGFHRAAPHGMTPHWLASPWWERGHADSKKDPRLVADIARRLRGETPWSGRP